MRFLHQTKKLKCVLAIFLDDAYNTIAFATHLVLDPDGNIVNARLMGGEWLLQFVPYGGSTYDPNASLQGLKLCFVRKNTRTGPETAQFVRNVTALSLKKYPIWTQYDKFLGVEMRREAIRLLEERKQGVQT